MAKAANDAEVAFLRSQLANLDAQRAAVEARLAAVLEPGSESDPIVPPTAAARKRIAQEKIAIFRRLFAGRPDVFALRWENAKDGRSGYAPACSNEWAAGVCGKPKIKCGACPNQAFIPVTDQAIKRHLRAPSGSNGSRADFVMGVYPLLQNDTCWFLAADFDGEQWAEDALAFIETCRARDYLRLLGIAPLLEKQPDFERKYLGWFIAAYFGGRADVRVRKLDVPIRLLDFTAMYASIFCVQRLDRILAAPAIRIKPVTGEIRALVGQMASDNPSVSLFDRKLWPKLNCLVLVDPSWTILPIRMRRAEKDPYTVAVTPIDKPEGRWYTLGDVLASLLLGGPPPNILRAIRAVPKGRRYSKMTCFRGAVELRSTEPFFKTIVEQREIAKRGAKDDPDLAALEIGLKQISASGGYGVHAEINVAPGKDGTDLPGEVYSDIAYLSPKVHDERPGAFANPIIATIVTGGARLMLALLESEVAKRGGTYAFCDTDSLAVNCRDQCPEGIPSLPESAIAEIVAQFDALNPYDREIVPHLLKVEYPQYPDLRCFAVSAKRYVLYRWRPGNRIQIVKASESALGAIIGRSKRESTPKLAERIWLSILMRHLNVNPGQRHRAKPLIDFDVPLRRKFPISQPAILKRLEAYNKPRSYDFRVKPFGFVQTIAPDRQTGENDVLPIAPFETNVRKSMKLQWVDFNTGDPIRLDWHRSAMAGTIGVTRLADYIDDYQRHPEAKAADQEGNPAGPETIGLLRRLRVRSKKLARIGKEVDRLDEDEGAALEPEQPIEYERDDLAEDIDYLATFPQTATARDLGLTERGWRKIIKRRPNSKAATVERIREVVALYRSRSGR